MNYLKGKDTNGNPMLDNKTLMGSNGMPEARDAGLTSLPNGTLNGGWEINSN